MMNKAHIASILGAAALAVAVTACGSDDSGSGSADGEASVTVDGKEVDLADNSVGCTDAGGKVTIGIGSGSGTSGVGVVLTSGDSPEVESVGLGSVDGVTLGFQMGGGDGKAEVTKDGKTYTITGEATGIDLANPTQRVTKPYEIKVTCP
ncbi:lipoprotein LpqH [Gordonia westfalica]|uniref:Ipoprotein LpqH n=1 Tax=Gordonia westfalica TaxID=158898 RepID=A0A1H2LY41_9ACTN|nr:lipoprotein LpqH [Gordonia westfalica]MDS1114022.1 lipoprotein LpqH [Gordonia westfalica]SDU85206.1 ipoprotein LpqH [Gordonia westfalica]